MGLTALLVYLSNGADPDRTSGLLDVVRVGLSIGAGSGGLFVLWLATRRQRSTEQTIVLQHESAQTTVTDSTERRITEQYNKAIEQLGHEKAAVRLGAIYSLERLAQEHTGHRQIVVDVFCSYLRLPYEPPTDREVRSKSGTGLSSTAIDSLSELEVRYAIQSMLWEHLGDPDQRELGEKRWPDIDLDLSRTTLIDPVLRQLAVRELKCEHMVVHGIADFRGLRVTRVAGISAHFYDKALFSDTILGGQIGLMDCVFTAELDLSNAKLFDFFITNSRFGGTVTLSAHSSDNIMINGCQFERDIVLSGATDTIVVTECDFQGVLDIENFETQTGVITDCSLRRPPAYHPNIVVSEHRLASNDFIRDFVARFGEEFKNDRRSILSNAKSDML